MDVECGEADWIVVVVSRHPLECVENGFLRRHAMAHVLHDGVCAGDADVLLAAARGPCAADFLVHKESGADDWRIAHAAGNLPREAAGGGDAGDLALGVQAEAIDGAGDGVHRAVQRIGQHRFINVREFLSQGGAWLLDGRAGSAGPVVVAALIAQRLLPHQPGEARFFGEQILFLVAPSLGEAESAFARKHHVIGLFHHQLCDLRRRLDAADGGNRSAAARWAVHYAGVELHYAFFVGQATVSDRIVFGVEFHQVDSGNDGIECIVPGLQHLHRAGTGDQAVGT